MKLFWNVKRTQVHTHKESGKKYIIRTTKLKYEPFFLFEIRHKLKMKIRDEIVAFKYWIKKKRNL